MKISPNKIITEEIINFLMESQSVSDDRFTFKQRLNNSYFYGYDTFSSEFDSEISDSDIIITWSASFWVNESGIENFLVNTKGIEGTFILKLFNKNTDELKQEVQKNIKDFQWKYVMNEATLPVNGSLYIKDLEFDFKNKTCIINF